MRGEAARFLFWQANRELASHVVIASEAHTTVGDLPYQTQLRPLTYSDRSGSITLSAGPLGPYRLLPGRKLTTRRARGQRYLQEIFRRVTDSLHRRAKAWNEESAWIFLS